MELGRIFVCTNLEFAADTNESTKRCPGGDLDGSSIVSLRNEGFSTFCICLRRANLVLRRNYGNRDHLLGQCCDGLFAIVAVSCIRL